ncbi:hypothetical protein KKE26_04485 [bacterium]|nr:hypothetical protein [bacterium]MBU1754173.1 hypothetical protein [bacterium]
MCGCGQSLPLRMQGDKPAREVAPLADAISCSYNRTLPENVWTSLPEGLSSCGCPISAQVAKT